MPSNFYLGSSWTSGKLEPRPSPIQGVGLFAREPIRREEVVSVVGGEPMSEERFEAFAATAERYNAIQIGEGLHLVERPEVVAEWEGSLNHSCDSNLWMADEVTLVARRDIAAGEEVTVDYALFTALPIVVIEDCRCSSPVCRRRVTGEDWRLPALRSRYAGHFSPFIEARCCGFPVGKERCGSGQGLEIP